MSLTTINVNDISTISQNFNCEIDEFFDKPYIKGDHWKGVGFNWITLKLSSIKIRIPYLTFFKDYINEKETHVYSKWQVYYREFNNPYREEDLRKIGRRIDMTNKKVRFLPRLIIKLKTSSTPLLVAYDSVQDATKALNEFNQKLETGKGIIIVNTIQL